MITKTATATAARPERTIEHSEQYQHFMVPVGSYPSRFVGLSRGVQFEILNGTLN